jgi:hypothetical protein
MEPEGLSAGTNTVVMLDILSSRRRLHQRHNKPRHNILYLGHEADLTGRVAKLCHERKSAPAAERLAVPAAAIGAGCPDPFNPASSAGRSGAANVSLLQISRNNRIHRRFIALR